MIDTRALDCGSGPVSRIASIEIVRVRGDVESCDQQQIGLVWIESAQIPLLASLLFCKRPLCRRGLFAGADYLYLLRLRRARKPFDLLLSAVLAYFKPSSYRVYDRPLRPSSHRGFGWVRVTRLRTFS